MGQVGNGSGKSESQSQRSVAAESANSLSEPIFQFSGKTANALQCEYQRHGQTLQLRFAKRARADLDAEVRKQIDDELRNMYFPLDSSYRYINHLSQEVKDQYKEQRFDLPSRYRESLLGLAREQAATKTGMDAWRMFVQQFAGMTSSYKLKLSTSL